MTQIFVTTYDKEENLEALLNDPRYKVRKWMPVCNHQGIFYCIEYEVANGGGED